MKKLLVLLFSLLISFNSYGEWTLVASGSDSGSGSSEINHYVDFDRINKQGKDIYFWQLSDYKINEFGDSSHIGKVRGNCNSMGIQMQVVYFYSDSMGSGKLNATDNEPWDWEYYPPGSVMDSLLKSVCDH